ncbi:DMT family transporter [Magnetococcus sp. PR-3]|uniref:DMT family transporter n=1 Tax=Magnetococcus sp. PR-3 TaxID=3120355 RepID=UPI002FCE0CC8
MEMVGWLPLALGVALFTALKDLLNKQSLAQLNPWTVAKVQHLTAFVVLLPLIPFLDVPTIGPDFWWALLGSGSINVVALLLYVQALQASDLSLTTPMLTTTPMFLLITSPIIVGEFPSSIGVFGIFFIVLGAWLLNVQQRHISLWAPFKALYRQRGPRLMLIIAFVWSVSSNLDKVGVQNSSPLFWLLALFAFIALGTSLAAHWYAPADGVSWRPHAPILWLQGGLFSAAALCQFLAIELTLVPYVIAVKRTSALMAVVLGLWWLKEQGGRERLMGSVVMFGGFLLITLAE